MNGHRLPAGVDKEDCIRLNGDTCKLTGDYCKPCQDATGYPDWKKCENYWSHEDSYEAVADSKYHASRED